MTQLSNYAPPAFVCTILLFISYKLVYYRYFHPLSKYPGPFWASITPFWELYTFLAGNQPEAIYRAHQRYGPIVRIRPWDLSVSSPSVFRSLFHNTNKTDFALGFQLFEPSDFLDELDSRQHYEGRKKFIHPYRRLTTHAPYEALLDQHVQSWIHRLGEFAISNTPCLIVQWLRYLSFDVIAELSFGARTECVSSGDSARLVANFGQGFAAMGIGNRFPALPRLSHNKFLRPYLTPSSASKDGIGLVMALHETLLQQHKRPQRKLSTAGTRTMVDDMLEAKNADGTPLDPDLIKAESLIPLMAGHDTVSTAAHATLYLLLTHPRCMRAVVSEIDAYLASHPELSQSEAISGRDLRSLKYLNNAIYEAIRVLPPFTAPLLREAPSAGLHLPDGSWVEGGTCISCHIYCTGRDKEYYGMDAEEFRPERWLEPSAGCDIQKMKQGFLGFGYGSRVCVGKDFAEMEMGKILFQLLRTYEVSLAPGVKGWGVKSWGFWVGNGYQVMVRRRS